MSRPTDQILANIREFVGEVVGEFPVAYADLIEAIGDEFDYEAFLCGGDNAEAIARVEVWLDEQEDSEPAKITLNFFLVMRALGRYLELAGSQNNTAD